MPMTTMSTAQRISQHVQACSRPASDNRDPALVGETSHLLARLQKIRSRSSPTTEGSFTPSTHHLPPRSSSKRDAGEEGGGGAHDELHWKDNLLTWTRGSTLVRTLTFSSPILQAFWTLFHVSSPDNVEAAPGKLNADRHTSPPVKALCVFFEQALHIHFPGLGEQLDMELPFRFSKAFPAPLGFLIQRQIESEDERIASLLHRPSLSAQPEITSSVGYPFPDISSSSESSYSFSQMLDDSDHASASQLRTDAARLLPMVFYLSRCHDDLVPVDRFPQLSFGLTPPDDPHPVSHGPASPFGELDESIVFVSSLDDARFPPFILTTAQHNSVIRIYAFAARHTAFDATATLLSAPRLPSSLAPAPTLSNGSPNAASAQMHAPSDQDGMQQPLFKPSRTVSDTPATKPLGRGFPSTLRRSARIDLERRTSGLTSATGMGRDPSGRSRRISAMQPGVADRRSNGRKDDATTQTRDRTLGNISHTADGLRLQSQTYQHEAMLEELGNAGTSMRIPGTQASAARIRRSSQTAARTPYNGPRTSNRTSSAAIKARPSMNLSRLDSSLDTGRMTSTFATGVAEHAMRADAADADAALNDDDDVDLARIADIDSFARGFASVCLLDEIKVSGLASHQHPAEIHVHTAIFDRLDSDAAYVFVSVPATNQTFCRRLGFQQLGPPDRARNLPFCKAPTKLQASSAIPCSALLPIQSISSELIQVLTISRTGIVELHFGPPSPARCPLDLTSFGPLAKAMEQIPGPVASLCSATTTPRARTLLLTSSGNQQQMCAGLDLRPRCVITARILATFFRTLPEHLAAKLAGKWILSRFLSVTEPTQRPSLAAAEEDWSAMLSCFRASSQTDAINSTAHRIFADDPLLSSLAPMLAKVDQAPSAPSKGAASLGLEPPEIQQAMLALYLLAEETRLDTSRHSDGSIQIAGLAATLAAELGASAWIEALCRRFALQDVVTVYGSRPPVGEATRSVPPTDPYTIVLDMLSGKSTRTSSLSEWISTSSKINATDRETAETFPLLHALFATYTAFSQGRRTAADVSADVVEAMLAHQLDLERLRRLPFGLALPLYQAIRCCQLHPPSGKSPEFYETIQRADIVLNAVPQQSALGDTSVRRIPAQLIRTLPEGAPLDAICAQLFSRDFRLRDVVALLSTESVNSVYVTENENQTEASINEQHSAAVAAVGERTKALSPGRAMLFMTSRPFLPTHRWRIPSICLAVKVRPRGMTIEPDAKMDMSGLDWPEFHNGVASVLELNVTADVKVDSKWIFAHLGEQVTARHAGFLYGLGLMKQLPSLTPVHVFRYLKMRNNLLTIGFLLGMAVSTLGTADPTARHLIGMQLTAFLPAGSAPLNLSIITQTAGLLAMGLVFLGSNHRWTAKRMLDQIGAQESPIANIQPQHREAYSMSAGLSLGLVYLGKGRGDGVKSLPDRRIVSRLVQLVRGGKDSAAGLSLTEPSRQEAGSGAVPELNLTSGPAALALGLVYLRSGNRAVADVMAPPQSTAELDELRPDVLFSHVLSRSLILWDGIEPTKAWIQGVLPAWMQERIATGKSLPEAAQLAQINMQAGACFAIGLKFSGSKDSKARDCLREEVDKLERQTRASTVSFFGRIQKSAVRAALDQVRISLGMVLAGSGDVTVLRHLRRAHGEVEGDTCYGSHMATHMALGLLFLGGGRYTLGTSDLGVAALLISFLPPFPRTSSDNRAHLQAFRHLWYLAIEPRLLIATDMDTNQLVSLPVKMSGVEGASTQDGAFTPLLLPNARLAGSIQTATTRYWPTSIESKARATNAAPGSAAVAGAPSLSTSQILYVKRKMAHLDYLADPHGSRSLASAPAETSAMDVSTDALELTGTTASELREALRGFAPVGRHEELVRSVSQLSSHDNREEGRQVVSTASLMRSVVMDCLSQDKMFVLPLYTTLMQLRRVEQADTPTWRKHYRDLRLADELYRHHQRRIFGDGQDDGSHESMALVQPGLVASLRRRAQQHAQTLFEEEASLRQAIVEHLSSSQHQDGPSQDADGFWLTLLASEVPEAEEVRALCGSMREFMTSLRNAADSGDEAQATARAEAGARMVADRAFGGAGQAPWTTYMLDELIGHVARSVAA
ncbi:hypothetical protein L1887_50314 [Cichorium endivia]|nr:hypothetical protein L1887_50314 [Cichorium endivia]